MAIPIILASGSASRRELLTRAGVDAEAIKSGVDEDELKDQMRAENMSVANQAMRLAEAKALEVSASRDGFVIGGDQMLALGSRAFDKPDGQAGVLQHLRDLSGQTHILETAIAIARDQEIVWRHLARPKLTMRQLNDDFITQYIENAGPEICNTVGGYQLEGIGIQLFSEIEGDYFSILGLPLLPLLDYLRQQGVLAT